MVSTGRTTLTSSPDPGTLLIGTRQTRAGETETFALANETSIASLNTANTQSGLDFNSLVQQILSGDEWHHNYQAFISNSPEKLLGNEVEQTPSGNVALLTTDESLFANGSLQVAPHAPVKNGRVLLAHYNAMQTKTHLSFIVSNPSSEPTTIKVRSVSANKSNIRSAEGLYPGDGSYGAALAREVAGIDDDNVQTITLQPGEIKVLDSVELLGTDDPDKPNGGGIHAEFYTEEGNGVHLIAAALVNPNMAQSELKGLLQSLPNPLRKDADVPVAAGTPLVGQGARLGVASGLMPDVEETVLYKRFGDSWSIMRPNGEGQYSANIVAQPHRGQNYGDYGGGQRVFIPVAGRTEFALSLRCSDRQTLDNVRGNIFQGSMKINQYNSDGELLQTQIVDMTLSSGKTVATSELINVVDGAEIIEVESYVPPDVFPRAVSLGIVG